MERFHALRIDANMQVSRKKLDRLIEAMAPSGNLFFLLTALELRRQGLSSLAFYVLQRTNEELEMSEYGIRAETGFATYEVSRACKLLLNGGLLEASRSERDRRFRLLRGTALGRKVQTRILMAASKRLAEGIPKQGRLRRISEATQQLRAGNRMLLGPLQLSFFDTDLFDEERPSAKKRRNPGNTP
jgi:DNA-binding MarR family transcriptional regulator